MEGGQPYLEDLLTMVINHLLAGMILQVVVWGIVGDYTAQLCGDYSINHEIRIPNKQPEFNGMSKGDEKLPNYVGIIS